MLLDAVLRRCLCLASCLGAGADVLLRLQKAIFAVTSFFFTWLPVWTMCSNDPVIQGMLPVLVSGLHAFFGVGAHQAGSMHVSAGRRAPGMISPAHAYHAILGRLASTLRRHIMKTAGGKGYRLAGWPLIASPHLYLSHTLKRTTCNFHLECFSCPFRHTGMGYLTPSWNCSNIAGRRAGFSAAPQ